MAPLMYPVSQGVAGVYGVQFDGVVVYVGGSARCMNNRMGHHRTVLRAGNHPSQRLQNRWNQDHPELSFVVLEVCEPSVVREREAHWTAELPGLLNKRREGERWKHSDHTREGMRAVAIQFASDPDERQRRSKRATAQHAEGRFGDHPPMTEGARQRLSASLRSSDKLKAAARSRHYDHEEMARRGRLSGEARRSGR